MPIFHGMPASPTFKVAKVARYLIPFVKPLTLGLIDPKDETIKELADAGLDFLGDEAKAKIKDYLTKEPDAATGLLDEHLVRHSGAVLAKLVKRYAKEAAPKEHRSDLLKIAKATPEGWSEFLQSDRLKMEPLRRDALQRRITATLSPHGKAPELEPEAFVEFFRWLARQKELLGPLKAGVTPPLTRWITQELDAQMLTDLCRDTTEGKAAFKESVLRFHGAAQQKLELVLSILHKQGESLARIEKKQEQQATHRDVGAVGTAVELGLKELKQLWSEFERTSPLHLYREALKEEYHFIEVITLDTANDPKVREAIAEHGIVLRDAYVEPPCSAHYQHPEEFDQDVTDGMATWTSFMSRLARHPRIVLLADPGMGKSTLIRSLIHSIASKKAPVEAGPELACCVPFPLILRNIVPMLLERQPDASKWRWADLLDVFQSWCPGNSTRPLLEPFTSSIQTRAKLQELFESPLAFFLIDGLDEVGSADLRRDMQRVLWEGFRSSHPNARFLITSRVIGYDAAPVHVERNVRLPQSETRKQEALEIAKRMAPSDQKFAEFIEKYGDVAPLYDHAQLLHLTPFTNKHQTQFAQYWFGKHFSRGGAEGSTQQFIQAAHAHDSVRLIGRNPYILLLLIFVYQDKHELPDGRTKIYDRVAELYLKVLDDKARLSGRLGPIARRSADQKKRWLQVIAMHMQLRRTETAADAQEWNKPQTRETHAATSAEIAGWLSGHIECDGYQGPTDAARAFVEYLGERTGLLVPRGPDHFEWHHNSFMEFFAALYLRDQLFVADQLRLAGYDYDAPRATLEAGGLPPESLPGPLPVRHSELARWAGDERWREVLIFLFEYMAGPGKAVELQRHLKGIFPGLHGHGSSDPDKHNPLLPLPAVDLAVRLAHDSHLDLPEPLRQSWWKRLWSAYLDWPKAPWAGQKKGAWPIAPLLLEREDRNTEVLQALAAVQPQYTKNVLFLHLCRNLTSADLHQLGALVSLTRLDLSSCTKLRDVIFLGQLSKLLFLNLSGCIGIRGKGCLSPLVGCPELETLYLYGCDGLSELEVLRQLPKLKVLDVSYCPGLQEQTCLGPLVECKDLTHLYFRGCTSPIDLEVLRHLSKLKTLDLTGSTGLIKPDCLTPLAYCSDLMHLDVSGCTGLSKADATAFCQKFRELHGPNKLLPNIIWP